MAEMIAYGLVRSKLTSPDDIVVSHYRQERLDQFTGSVPVQSTLDNTDACARGDIVVLCVRPQGMAAVLQEIGEIVDPGKLVITIAAGLPISFYERFLPQGVPFVRAMPTFFGHIKSGTTGLALNAATTAEHLALASRLFGTISENVIVLPDAEMDSFTTFG